MNRVLKYVRPMNSCKKFIAFWYVTQGKAEKREGAGVWKRW